MQMFTWIHVQHRMSTLIVSNVDIALRHVSAPSLHVNMLYVSRQHANIVMSTCNTGDVNAPNMHVGLVKTEGFLMNKYVVDLDMHISDTNTHVTRS